MAIISTDFIFSKLLLQDAVFKGKRFWFLNRCGYRDVKNMRIML